MAHSEIPPEVIEAYVATHYRVGTGGDAFTLRIDKHSPALVRVYAAHGCHCAAFITAWNPRSVAQPAAVNAAAHERLCKLLRRRGIELIEGAGVGQDSQWREQSVFALGMSREDAEAVGCDFDQNAIVWVGADAVPRLCLLR